MKQDPKSQIPGVDLTFADGSTGKIWGVSGLNDLKGESFVKANRYLQQRARQDGAFDWTIVVELDQVISSAVTSLMALMISLDKLVTDKPDRRSIVIDWRIKPGDDHMRSLAHDVKEKIEPHEADSKIEKISKGKLKINIVELKKSSSVKR